MNHIVGSQRTPIEVIAAERCTLADRERYRVVFDGPAGRESRSAGSSVGRRRTGSVGTDERLCDAPGVELPVLRRRLCRWQVERRRDVDGTDSYLTAGASWCLYLHFHLFADNDRLNDRHLNLDLLSDDDGLNHRHLDLYLLADYYRFDDRHINLHLFPDDNSFNHRHVDAYLFPDDYRLYYRDFNGHLYLDSHDSLGAAGNGQ